MQVVHKQTLQHGRNFINLRGRDAKILSIQPQGNGLSVWYQTHSDDTYPTFKQVEFFAIYTGKEFEQDLPYIATYQVEDLAVHVYGDFK